MKLSKNFEELTKQVIEEHNKLRENPYSYVEKLEAQLKFFKEDVLYRPNEDPIKTFEGKAAYEEAIEFLKKQLPINVLTYDERLNQACQDHVNDIGPKGLASHEGSDGKTSQTELKNFVNGMVSAARILILVQNMLKT